MYYQWFSGYLIFGVLNYILLTNAAYIGNTFYPFLVF